MRTFILLALLATVPAPGAIIFSNGAPNGDGGANFTDFRTAEDFTVSLLRRITTLRFWTFTQSTAPADNPTATIASLGWAIYANSAGAPGALVQSGTATNLTGTSAGTNLGLREIAVDFDLAAGDYFLELHAGPTLDTAGATQFNWATTADNASLRYLLSTDLNTIPNTEVNAFLGSGLLQLAFEIEGSAPVPEPGSLALGLGGLALVGLRFWNRRFAKT